MPFSQDEQQSFQAWLNERATPRAEKCRVCGHEEYQVSRSGLFEREGSEISTDQALPLIVMECQNCGNIVLFNENAVDL